MSAFRHFFRKPRDAVFLIVLGLILLIAGAYLDLAGTFNWQIVGFMLMGIGSTMIVSSFFLLVGYSDEKHRQKYPNG